MLTKILSITAITCAFVLSMGTAQAKDPFPASIVIVPEATRTPSNTQYLTTSVTVICSPGANGIRFSVFFTATQNGVKRSETSAAQVCTGLPQIVSANVLKTDRWSLGVGQLKAVVFAVGVDLGQYTSINNTGLIVIL